MTYVNPILSRGVDAFCATAATAGISGLIVPDLPVEESGPLQKAADRYGIGLVQFVAPTTNDDRIGRVLDANPPFIYLVADLGVTGRRDAVSRRALDLAEALRARTDIPIVMGVGISTPEQARLAATVADGVIVGTAVVAKVMDEGVVALESLARSLADAVHTAR